MIPGIYSAGAATHEATDTISALKNTALSAPFSPLGTEKLDVLRNLEEIFQEQTIAKTKLETPETQTKIVEQKQNRTHPPPRVKTQAVTILEALTHPKRCKAKSRTPTPPHLIPLK